MIPSGVHSMIDVEAMLALEKHGPLTKDPVRGCAILGREWGEAMNEALLATRPGQTVQGQYEAKLRLRTELAQVAATAALMITYLQEA